MSNRDDSPRAVVREVDGRLVLFDPDALAIVRAVERENIRRFLSETEPRGRIQYFAGRVVQRGDTGYLFLIVMLCVDDPNGAALADILMPGHDWSAYRARGEQPWARGLTSRPRDRSRRGGRVRRRGLRARDRRRGAAMTVIDRAWTRGYAAALASIWRLHHDGQMVRHLINANGITLNDLRDAIGDDDRDYRAIVAAVGKPL